MISRQLTLEQALAIAAAQNVDVQKAVQYRNWVDGKYFEERASALPQITFSATALRQFDDSQSRLFRNAGALGGAGSGGTSIGDLFGGRQDVGSAEIRITQPLFTWGQLGAAVRAARLGYRFADVQVRRFRQLVAKDVSTAFFDALVARDLAAFAKDDLAQRQRHLEDTVYRREVGTVTEYDVLAAQVAVQNARPAAIRADNAVRAARDKLRFLLADTTNDVDPVGILAVPIRPLPSYAVTLERALANRPEIAELASQRAIYAELVTIARAAGKPRVDFTSGIGTRALGLSAVSATGATWNAAVVASMSLFDGMRARGRTTQAEIDLARVALDEKKLRDSIALEVRLAIDAAREAAEIVAAVGDTVKQADRLLFLAEKGYEFGVKTHLEVQDAATSLLAARTNLARAERDYRVALVGLDWTTGTLNANAAERSTQ